MKDKAAGIFNAFYSFGAILAPIMGGFLNDLIDYRSTNDVMAIMSIVFTILFFLLNTKPKDFKINKPRSIKYFEPKIDFEK